jgi:hypothetical protein
VIGDALLTYTFDTSPHPLQASRSGTLTMQASNLDPDEPINCDSIKITIRTGTTAADLANDLTTVVVSQPDGWSARLEGNIYAARPSSREAARVGARSVRMSFAGIPINDAPGATRIIIDEKTSIGSAPTVWRSCEILIPKFPAAFTLSELTAAPDPIESGGKTYLSWRANDLPGLVTYELRWVSDGKPETREVGKEGPQLIEDIVGSGTVMFTLYAYIGGASISKQRGITILPRAPVIDELSGTVLNGKLTIRWKSKYASHVTITGSSAHLASEGSLGPFDINHIYYTVTAHNQGVTAQRDLFFVTDPDPDVRVRPGATPRVTLAPDGSWLIVSQAGDKAMALDGATLSRREDVGRMSDYVSTVAFRDDGECFFITSRFDNKDFALIVGRDLEVRAESNQLGWVRDAVYSANGRSIFVSVWVQGASAVLRLDAATLAVKERYEFPELGNFTLLISRSDDDAFLYVIGSESKLVELDLRTSTRRSVTVGGPPYSGLLRFWRGTSKKYVIFRDSRSRTTKLIDAETLEVVRTLPYVLFTIADSALLGATGASNEGDIEIFDLETLSVKHVFSLPTENDRHAIGFGAGALITTRGHGFASGWQTDVRRHVIASAVAEPQTVARSRATLLDYWLLASDGTIVVVAAPDEETSIERIDVGIAGDAEAPAGWRVEQRDGVTSFTSAAGVVNDLIAFTIRNVPQTGDVTLTEYALGETRTLQFAT